MEEQTNLILTTIEAIGMNPRGILTGFFGAILNLFVMNGNSFTIRKLGLIVTAGLIICGYSLWILLDYFGDDSRGASISYILNILIGFIASDLLASIKGAAPTFTNVLVKAITSRAEKLVGGKTKNDAESNNE